MKDPVLSLPWRGFCPWPGNFRTLRVWSKNQTNQKTKTACGGMYKNFPFPFFWRRRLYRRSSGGSGFCLINRADGRALKFCTVHP